MAGSVWLTHRDMNATSSQPRARRSRRWRKGLNPPSPARCRSRAWTAGTRRGRAAGIGEGRLDRGEPRETKPRWMHGSSRTARRTPRARRLERPGQHSCTPRWRSYGFCLMFSLGWLETAVAHRRVGPAASATVRPAFSQRTVVLVPSTRNGAGGCGITPADSTRAGRSGSIPVRQGDLALPGRHGGHRHRDRADLPWRAEPDQRAGRAVQPRGGGIDVLSRRLPGPRPAGRAHQGDRAGHRHRRCQRLGGGAGGWVIFAAVVIVTRTFGKAPEVTPRSGHTDS
jgi:hypothetical protein